MKRGKSINNISTKLLNEIPKLKPGEVVLFQMLNGVPNPEPDEKERSRSPMLYGKVQLMTNFRIYDPYLADEKGNETGGYVDVGAVESWNQGEPDRFVCFVPGKGNFSQFQGKFQLTGGNVADEELYQVLWLSPQREGNPYRDLSVEPMFRIIDLKSEAASKITKVENLKKALNLNNTLQPDEMRMIFAALNKPDYNDDSVLQAEFGELCRTEPEEVIKTYENVDTPNKAMLRAAFNKNILSYNMINGEVKVGNATLTTITGADPSNIVPDLLLWLKTAPNGRDVMANIRSQVTASMPKKVTAPPTGSGEKEKAKVKEEVV